ncbi:MAG TPA: hypothetical protein PK280_19820, partial [Planctomycetota bacterium]|nr:hypothetical protein [Planctomycetota bacterium]
MSRPASLPEGGGARRAGALSALIPILAGCLSGAGEPPVAPGAAPPVTTAAPARPDPVFGAPAPQPAPPSRQDPAEPVGPLRREEPARPPEFEGAPPAADASVLLRHRVDATRRLVYAGVCEDEVLAGVGEGANESVIKRSWRVARRHLLLGSADGAPAEMVSSSLEELAAATWAGRDALTDMRSRPWNGRRLGSGRRRFSERGVEPLPSDTSPDQFLEPLPEFPRLPRGRLTAAAPLVESVAPYQVEWRLTGAGTLGKRRCWQATRTVSRPSGGRPAPADLLGFQDEYLLDAADGTVLRVRRTSARPAGFMGHIRELSLALVEDTPEAPAAFDREAREAAETSRLLGAIGERRPDLAVELAARSSAPVRDGPAAALARRYADGEKALAEARGGARRV